MDEKVSAAMIEATRLTREGRLNEATQRIQRALGLGRTRTGTSTDVADEPERIGKTFRLTVEPVMLPEVSQPAGRERTMTEEERPTVAEQRVETATTEPWATLRRPPLRRPGGLPLPGMPGVHRKRGPLPRPAPPGGQWMAKAHTNAGGTHAYKLFVPSQYRGEPMPLVVMLHGCTQDPDDFAAGTAMNFLAEEAGFLVAYPAQANCANASKCWNWFQTEHQQRGKGEPSFIAGITREVMTEYHADARSHLCGRAVGGRGDGGHHGSDLSRPVRGCRRAFRPRRALRPRPALGACRHAARRAREAVGRRPRRAADTLSRGPRRNRPSG